MIFRLKTSKRTQEIFQELENRTNYKPYTLVNEQRIMQLDQVMVSGISTIPGISLTNPSEKRLPGIISIVVDKKDFNNERFIKNISDKFALSTGSACSAGEPSYVITALGLEDRVSKVLRISLNKYTTEEEIHQLINILKSEL